MARTNPLQFIQQVRAETAKVVWPTRRETGLTTVMVMIMATLFAIFFFLSISSSASGSRAMLLLGHRLLNLAPAGVMRALLGRNAARVDSVARPFFDCAPRGCIGARSRRQEDRGRSRTARRLR